MRLRTRSAVDPATRDAVWNGLLRHNLRFARRNQKDFTVSVEEAGAIVGGAIGESKFDWLIVQYLWVDERLRGTGLGTRIMAAVERLAIRRRCAGIFLDTFSFQAPGFYRGLGYRRIGRLDGHPRGHAKFWYAKWLDGDRTPDATGD